MGNYHQTHVRCRLWARRVFRGRDLGVCQILRTHEPDWRLAHPDEAERLLQAASDPRNAAPDVPVRCVAPMPPLLAVYLRRRGSLPPEVLKKADAAAAALSTSEHPRTAEQKEADGLLLLTKIPWNPELCQVSGLLIIPLAICICFFFKNDCSMRTHFGCQCHAVV